MHLKQYAKTDNAKAILITLPEMKHQYFVTPAG